MKVNDRIGAGSLAGAQEGGDPSVVLHLLPQGLNRGAQIYAGHLRDALRGDPRQRHLLVTLFDGPEGRARPDIRLGVSVGPLRRLLDPRVVVSLRRLKRSLQAEWIVAHGGEALKYAIAAGGANVIYKRTGLSTNEIHRFGRASLYGFLSRRARVVVGVSHELLAQAHDLMHVPQERLVYIPNSRDPDVYRPLQSGETASTSKKVLFVGQLEPGKRPELFLDVVASLREHGHAFDAAMVGDGRLRSAISQRAAELGVNLLGVRTDVPELIRASTVIVMTSAPGTEGMPGVLIEAGLSGIPVVATRASGVADVIRHGETGFIVDDADARAIAGHIGALLKDSVLRSAQGRAARERCLELFSIGATAVQWRELIAALSSPSAGRVTKR